MIDTLVYNNHTEYVPFDRIIYPINGINDSHLWNPPRRNAREFVDRDDRDGRRRRRPRDGDGDGTSDRAIRFAGIRSVIRTGASIGALASERTIDRDSARFESFGLSDDDDDDDDHDDDDPGRR